MIQCHFDRLRREKASRENRDLPVLTVSAETGLSYNTLQRLRRERLTRIQLSTIETLCRYFTVETMCELLEYKADLKAEAVGEKP